MTLKDVTQCDCGIPQGSMCQWSPILAFFLIFPYKMPKKYFFVRGLQPRGYIAECFQLFLVVVEGPNGCYLLVRFSCDVW